MGRRVVLVPPELASWIEAHRGIVQPYALGQLASIVHDLTTSAAATSLDVDSRTTVTVRVEDVASIAVVEDGLLITARLLTVDGFIRVVAPTEAETLPPSTAPSGAGPVGGTSGTDPA